MYAYTFSMFDYRSITCTEYPTQDFDLQAFIPRALSTYMTNGHITHIIKTKWNLLIKAKGRRCKGLIYSKTETHLCNILPA